MLLACAIVSCEPGTASKPTPAKAPKDDPCVAVRAEYFRQEQFLLLTTGAAGGGAPNDPLGRALLASYKLEHPTCFF